MHILCSIARTMFGFWLQPDPFAGHCSTPTPQKPPARKINTSIQSEYYGVGAPFQTDTTISPPINCSFPTLFVQCPDLCKFARRHTKLATLMRHIVRSSLCTPVAGRIIRQAGALGFFIFIAEFCSFVLWFVYSTNPISMSPHIVSHDADMMPARRL